MKILIFCLFLGALSAFSQDTSHRSDSITTVNDTLYYVHTVIKSETAYSLSKLYNVSLETFYKLNPNALHGIRLGENLLLPMENAVSGYATKPSKTSVSTDPNFYIYHRVKAGETYYGIAQIYHIKPDDIRRANPELKDILPEGTSLRIPYDQEILTDIKKQQEANAGGENVYIVHTGETLFSISQRLNTTVNAIIKANPDVTKGLRDGDAIKIPQPEPKLQPQPPQEDTNGKNYHVVKQSETVYSIAKNYGISIDSILAHNKQIIDNRLTIGDTLLIPYYRNIYGFIEYRPDKKETLFDIANRFKVSLRELSLKNPGYDNIIPKGKIVLIPVVQEKPKQEERKEIIPEEPATFNLLAGKDSLCIGGWNTEKTFHVALMLPFSLNKMSSTTFSNLKVKNKVSDYDFFKYIQFYQAALMALDSLSEMGINIRFSVYDVGAQSDMDQILMKNELKDVDLIIGIIFTTQFSSIAQYAKENNIQVINVLSRRDDILNGYPNVVKIMPDEVFASQAASSIIPQNTYPNIVIVTETNGFLTSETQELHRIFPHAKTFSMAGSRMASILNQLDAYRDNYIFVIAKNKPKIMDLMRVLDEEKKEYRITLTGYPSWDEIQGMDYGYAQNLNLHFITPVLIDYENPETNQFIYQFRARFNDEPNQYAFQGYDITKFFISNLAYFGKNCLECSKHVTPSLLSTNQIALRNTPGNGYENTYWNIYYIKDYKIVPVK